MKAAVLFSPRTPLEIEHLNVEAPRQGEVLVRMAASGVCGSDDHVVSGATPHAMPVVLGHEGAGIVLQVGPGVRSISPGDHVVLSWVPICGECFFCLRGLPAHCQRSLVWAWEGVQADGSSRFSLQNGEPVFQLSAISTFVEESVVPAISCIPVRKDVPLTWAALVGCGVTTGFGAVVNTARVQPGDSLAVFGCGGVGLNVIQSARVAGARHIIAVDVVPSKLSLAETMGATHLVNPAENDPIDFINQLTGGRGVDHAFEVIGRPEVMRQAYQVTRPCGNTVLVGIGPHDAEVGFPAGGLPRSSRRVMGSYYGDADPRLAIPRILDLVVAGLLDLETLISQTYRLEDINQAFEDMQSGEAARGVIVF